MNRLLSLKNYYHVLFLKAQINKTVSRSKLCVDDVETYLACEYATCLSNIYRRDDQTTRHADLRGSEYTTVYPTSTAHTHTQSKLLMSEFSDYNSHTHVFSDVHPRSEQHTHVISSTRVA